MPTQPNRLSDTIAQLSTRVSALESTSIDDSQPVDMYRAFNEMAHTTERFSIYTHKYHVCSETEVCSETLLV